ncbi:MAG: DMT family transporter [Gammaproteobacteria bacterium]|nr:DMT family transporter [Gammaproteobacteria bacterium]
MDQKPSILDWIYILGLSAVWGSAFVFIRIAAPELGAIGLVFLRLVIASLLLGMIFLKQHHWSIFKKNLLPIIVIGATNVALPFYCFAYAALHINASSMAVINGSTPLFAFIFSMLILGFKFRIIQFSGIVIGLAGLIIFVGFESLDFNLLPILAAAMGAAFYGISMVYIYKLNIVDTKAMAAITMIIATVLISPFLYLEPLNLVGLSTKALFSILFLGIFCTGLAYIPYFILIKNIGPISTSIIAMLVPLFGMLWAYLLLKETITLTMLGGCLLIIMGVLLTNLSDNGSSKKP